MGGISGRQEGICDGTRNLPLLLYLLHWLGSLSSSNFYHTGLPSMVPSHKVASTVVLALARWSQLWTVNNYLLILSSTKGPAMAFCCCCVLGGLAISWVLFQLPCCLCNKFLISNPHCLEYLEWFLFSLLDPNLCIEFFKINYTEKNKLVIARDTNSIR